MDDLICVFHTQFFQSTLYCNSSQNAHQFEDSVAIGHGYQVDEWLVSLADGPVITNRRKVITKLLFIYVNHKKPT